MSEEPKIVALAPAVMELEPGTYHWCACGHSEKQPFCDGSHKGTGIEPLEFEITEKKTVGMCLCKHSEDPPFCDGAHSVL